MQKVAASSPSFFSEVSRDAASSPSASQTLLSDLPALQKTPYFSLQSGLVPLPPAWGRPPERRLENGGEGEVEKQAINKRNCKSASRAGASSYPMSPQISVVSLRRPLRLGFLAPLGARSLQVLLRHTQQHRLAKTTESSQMMLLERVLSYLVMHCTLDGDCGLRLFFSFCVLHGGMLSLAKGSVYTTSPLRNQYVVDGWLMEFSIIFAGFAT